MDPILEQSIPEQSVSPQPALQQEVSEKKPSTFPFMEVGLIVLGTVALLGLGIGVYYLTAKKNSSHPQQIRTIPTTTPSVHLTLSPSPAPSIAAGQVVTGGGVLSFSKYQITVPSGWKISRSTLSAETDETTITKDGYTFTLLQGGMDGGACSYPDKIIDNPGPTQDFSSFVDLKDMQSNSYRRGLVSDTNGLPAGTQSYEVCFYNTKDTVFEEFTPFGVIDYRSPINPDTATLEEMDSIVISLTLKP